MIRRVTVIMLERNAPLLMRVAEVLAALAILRLALKKEKEGEEEETKRRRR
jgi:hypothetical protein